MMYLEAEFFDKQHAFCYNKLSGYAGTQRGPDSEKLTIHIFV